MLQYQQNNSKNSQYCQLVFLPYYNFLKNKQTLLTLSKYLGNDLGKSRLFLRERGPNSVAKDQGQFYISMRQARVLLLKIGVFNFYIMNFMTENLRMQEVDKENQCQNKLQIKKLFKQSSQYRLGSFVFKPELSEQEIKTLVSGRSAKLATVHSAYRYCKQEMQTVRLWLNYCTQWDHGILELGSHGFRNFFSQFQGVSMRELLVLNLENNNINSIELIQNLDAPNLDCLYLHGNPIVTVKSLRKANFPKMTRLYINVSDNEYLSQFSGRELGLIQNQPRTPQCYQWRKYNSVRWIAKMESTKLRRVLTGTQKYAARLDSMAHSVLANKNKGLKID